MYKDQDGEIRSANKHDLPNTSGNERTDTQIIKEPIIRIWEWGQITVTFADHDDPDTVNYVLGLLLQAMAKVKKEEEQ